jgi:hypothetical protein
VAILTGAGLLHPKGSGSAAHGPPGPPMDLCSLPGGVAVLVVGGATTGAAAARSSLVVAAAASVAVLTQVSQPTLPFKPVPAKSFTCQRLSHGRSYQYHHATMMFFEGLNYL